MKYQVIHGEGRSASGPATREYQAWLNARHRVLSADRVDFHHYGGRGITMCREWLSSYPSFLKDMGRCPQGYTLERRNVNGHYEPSNCCWASRKAQSNNRRNNVQITFQGRTQNIKQWAEELGIVNQTLWARIVILKWPVDAALTTPTKHKHEGSV